MANKRFDGSYKRPDTTIKVALEIVTWEEDGIYYYYSPAIDLTGYGNSDKEAQESFEIILADFIDYTHNKNTIYEELERLGWTVNKSKKSLVPPSNENLLNENTEYRKLMSREDIQKNIRQELVSF